MYRGRLRNLSTSSSKEADAFRPARYHHQRTEDVLATSTPNESIDNSYLRRSSDASSSSMLSTSKSGKMASTNIDQQNINAGQGYRSHYNAYSQENSYDCVYAEKVIVHTIENIITKDVSSDMSSGTVIVDGNGASGQQSSKLMGASMTSPLIQGGNSQGSRWGRSSRRREDVITEEVEEEELRRGRRRGGGMCGGWCWPWILLPLLVCLLPLALMGASDNLRNSVCSYLSPVPIPTAARKTLEIVTLKKFYHYFVPQVNNTPSSKSGFTSDDAQKLQSVLSTIDSRLDSVENEFKKINGSIIGNSGGGGGGNPTSKTNHAKDIQSLKVLFIDLDKRIAELEKTSSQHHSSSQTQREKFDNEIASIKGQVSALNRNMRSIGDDQKSFGQRLDELLVANRRQQEELNEINARLDSLAKSDCDCTEAVVPGGAISKHEVDRLITEAIRHYDADKTGLPDYALEPAGGTILSTRCTETYPSNTREHSFFGLRIPFWPRDYSPRTVIQPGLNPGECWAFKGAHGYLVIRLSGLIRVTAVSYEHIPKEISPDGNIFSAPKDLEVYALSHEMDQNGTRLGTFTYDADGTPLQYFPVQVHNASATEILELRVLSNHGHPQYTCLYRFRVHGKRLNPGWPSFGGSTKEEEDRSGTGESVAMP